MDLAQEALQHGHRCVQVRDDPVPEGVDDVDVLGFLAGQGVRGVTHGYHPAGFPVDGDRGRLLEHDPAAGDVDKRVDRAEVDRYAWPQPHAACPLPVCCYAFQHRFYRTYRADQKFGGPRG